MATVMGGLLVPVHPLECVILRTVRHASIILTVTQTVQLFREVRRDMKTMQQTTHVADLLIINVYRTHHQPSVTSGETFQKIEDSMKSISETRRMKPEFNGGI
jgi:hypothetical protein